jgi:hypothetical protein
LPEKTRIKRKSRFSILSPLRLPFRHSTIYDDYCIFSLSITDALDSIWAIASIAVGEFDLTCIDLRRAEFQGEARNASAISAKISPVNQTGQPAHVCFRRLPAACCCLLEWPNSVVAF